MLEFALLNTSNINLNRVMGDAPDVQESEEDSEQVAPTALS